jgi:hypothetical protein
MEFFLFLSIMHQVSAGIVEQLKPNHHGFKDIIYSGDWKIVFATLAS